MGSRIWSHPYILHLAKDKPIIKGSDPEQYKVEPVILPIRKQPDRTSNCKNGTGNGNSDSDIEIIELESDDADDGPVEYDSDGAPIIKNKKTPHKKQQPTNGSSHNPPNEQNGIDSNKGWWAHFLTRGRHEQHLSDKVI